MCDFSHIIPNGNEVAYVHWRSGTRPESKSR